MSKKRTKIPHKCNVCNKQLYLDNQKYIEKNKAYYYICDKCDSKDIKK